MFRRAHVLLHTKVNDPCPTVVIEAMACGVPVAYPASGGTVELVGDVGWGRRAPRRRLRSRRAASGRGLAAAVSAVLADRDRYASAARSRTVERFALADWLDRHAAIFAELVPRSDEPR